MITCHDGDQVVSKCFFINSATCKPSFSKSGNSARYWTRSNVQQVPKTIPVSNNNQREGERREVLALERAGRRGIADEKHRARVQPRTGLGTRVVLGRGVPVAMQPRALPVIKRYLLSKQGCCCTVCYNFSEIKHGRRTFCVVVMQLFNMSSGIRFPGFITFTSAPHIVCHSCSPFSPLIIFWSCCFV